MRSFAGSLADGAPIIFLTAHQYYKEGKGSLKKYGSKMKKRRCWDG